MAKEYLVTTIVGPDRRGIVEKITAVTLDYQANIEESRMARLGGEFAVIMLLSLPGERKKDLLTGLDSLAEHGLTIITRQTSLSRLERFQGYVPYEISVFGADHEGIVHSVAQYLTSERMNIETMDTHVTKADRSEANAHRRYGSETNRGQISPAPLDARPLPNRNDRDKLLPII